MSKRHTEGEIEKKKNPKGCAEQPTIRVAAANPKEMRKKATIAARAGGMIERMREARERKIARETDRERKRSIERERTIGK